ncbi:hypothetical protein BH24ACT5_BH24ACT5_01040 [soil metagenome]
MRAVGMWNINKSMKELITNHAETILPTDERKPMLQLQQELLNVSDKRGLQVARCHLATPGSRTVISASLEIRIGEVGPRRGPWRGGPTVSALASC